MEIETKSDTRVMRDAMEGFIEKKKNRKKKEREGEQERKGRKWGRNREERKVLGVEREEEGGKRRKCGQTESRALPRKNRFAQPSGTTGQDWHWRDWDKTG